MSDVYRGRRRVLMERTKLLQEIKITDLRKRIKDGGVVV